MRDLNEKLIAAIYRKEKRRILEAIRKGADINACDEDGRSPLMHAILAEDADPEIVRLLIDNGANVNLKDYGQEWTALHFAARDCHIEIVKILIDNGAEIDPRNTFGNTPLMEAVYNCKGNPEIIEMLLIYGADKNAVNNYGVSPASLAEIMTYDVIKEILSDS